MAIFVAVACISAGLLIGYLTSDSGSDNYEVRVVIEYSGSWSGSVGSIGGSATYDHAGDYQITLDRDEGTLWVVSAVIQKDDGGSGVLMVSIVDMDGHVLKTSSTSAAYGVATVSAVIE
jgi:hypothetical protein